MGGVKRPIHQAAPLEVMHRSASELAKSHARCLHGIVPSGGSQAFRSLCARPVLLELPAGRPRHREEV
jgi:hypothetical protein